MTSPHQRLVEALLGDRHEHHRAYTHSPSFHHAVDQLAAWLPIWLEAMASACQLADARHAEATELAKRDLAAMRFDPESGEVRNGQGQVIMTVPEQYRTKVSILRTEPEPLPHSDPACHRRHTASGQLWATRCARWCPCSCHTPTTPEATTP